MHFKIVNHELAIQSSEIKLVKAEIIFSDYKSMLRIELLHWKVTGRRKRCIAAVPTEVERASVVEGNGPPCVME